jgi:hypothetical protein
MPNPHDNQQRLAMTGGQQELGQRLVNETTLISPKQRSSINSYTTPPSALLSGGEFRQSDATGRRE